MEEFPPFCVQCKCIGHVKGECRIHSSSTPLTVVVNASHPITHVVVNAIICDETVHGMEIGPSVVDTGIVVSQTVVGTDPLTCVLGYAEEEVTPMATFDGVNKVMGANN
ncbi:hypothetical protein IEQ34_014708 [Dendrobium chrysotoxum]|uniref:Uncharacterized protein n=1 Tax=Dendrobium chrysotoxum TaxID=161865 RepID=A0AAV7GL00_DENCH|nr:hypothetical protein IEQ34_014708 [Dendrobium chrysotoxum]